MIGYFVVFFSFIRIFVEICMIKIKHNMNKFLFIMNFEKLVESFNLISNFSYGEMSRNYFYRFI